MEYILFSISLQFYFCSWFRLGITWLVCKPKWHWGGQRLNKEAEKLQNSIYYKGNLLRMEPLFWGIWKKLHVCVILYKLLYCSGNGFRAAGGTRERKSFIINEYENTELVALCWVETTEHDRWKDMWLFRPHKKKKIWILLLWSSKWLNTL